MSRMTDQLPLTTLLSRALIALTIDIDTEIELRLPHFTTSHGSSNPGLGGPWLISLAMWADFLRHLAAGQLPVVEVYRRAGLDARTVKGYLGLERWGYVLHRPDADDPRPKVPKKDWVVTQTANGKRWHDTYPVVIAEVEQRWKEHHGQTAIDHLRDALEASIDADAPMPQYLPVVTGDLRTHIGRADPPEPPQIGLVGLLARALLGPTLRLESDLPLSMPVLANVVRVTDDEGVLVRDLPHLTGAAKEGVTWMSNVLVRGDHATIDVVDRKKRLRLTDAGRAAKGAYDKAVGAIDDAPLRAALEPIDVSPAARYERGWRAKVNAPDTLPHHPIVLHRGAYPDGA
jgi:hypothetical protein